MHKAVFLDRDGVMNRLVYNPDTDEYESPHQVNDLELFPGLCDTLCTIREQGYLLFLISNQPSFAKGKTSLENIKAIHEKLHSQLKENGILFSEYYYCYHHPHGIVPEYTFECECRKPKPYFILKAKEQYNLELKESWFIGDQDMDIFCGQACGLRTILIDEEHSSKKRGRSRPDFMVHNLKEAATIL
jgi:D-glycero-D-manno-heptose 1,7-bisphosphate phosphatase